MKLYAEKQDVAVCGNFETSDFNVGDIAFIVDMFADKVYSHKERAVIRELSCNAHDSHVEAGTTHIPFKVHLPTQLEPYFCIRDFGTGLTDHEVRNIFAGIGISTKRDSNEVIGCFGIGSLSPYSMTDSFTVKSYHNGVVRTYTCYRDNDRKPVVSLLTESETDEDNGLEISLSVEDRVWQFSNEAEYVFKFWEGTVPEINDESVQKTIDDTRNGYIFKGEDFGLSTSWGRMVALMGNIAYQIPPELDDFNTEGYLKFELGELSFDTARENLAMDDKTKQAIKDKTKKIKEKLAEEAGQQISALPTAFKRAVMANNLQAGALGRHIKTDLNQYLLPETSKEFTYFQRSYRSTDKGTSTRVPVGQDIQYYRHKDRMQTRIREYIKDHNRMTMVILTDEQVKECLIDEDVLLDLDDLPKVHRQSYANTGSKVKTFVLNRDYAGWEKDRNWGEIELTITGDEIVYVEISRWEVQGGGVVYSTAKCIRNVLERLENCGIVAPRVVGLKTAFLKTKQFKKGNFIDLSDYVKRELNDRAPATYQKYDDGQLSTLKKLNKNIKHSHIESLIDLAEEKTTTATIANWLTSIADRNGKNTKMVVDTTVQDMIDEFFDQYEMLSFLGSWEITNKNNARKIAKYTGGEVRNENHKPKS